MPAMTHKRTAQTGKRGEQIAREFLTTLGYRIREVNWRCPVGEIDIIAEQGDILVFVEVKTRRSTDSGDALMLVTPRKQKRLLNAVYTYLEAHALDAVQWRVDVIAVTLQGSESHVEQVEDALGW